MLIGIEIESVIVGTNMYKYFLIYKDINGNIIKEEEVPENQTVIGRYSVISNYNELERDLEFKNTNLINSYHEHTYILDIEKFIPKTYFYPNDLPKK